MASQFGVCAGRWFREYSHLYPSITTVFDAKYNEIFIEGYEIRSMDALSELPRNVRLIVFTPIYREICTHLRGLGFSDITIGGPEKFLQSFDMQFTYMPVIGRQRQDYSGDDPIRYSTLELLADEIKTRNVRGSVAEVGVFQGDTLEKLAKFLPGRAIYAFDTFSGFEGKDLDFENFKYPTQSFTNTSVELVKERLSFAGQSLILRQGYFPDSIQSLEEDDAFSLVSLDADLYLPILSGLNFFGPRMSRGGFIAVHNYNDFTYPGTRQAVNRFLGEVYSKNKPYRPRLVPITDPGGTAILAF
jgi:O-methyltransferase